MRKCGKRYTQVGIDRGWDFNGYLKTGMEPQAPPCPEFGTRMENNYIFWNGNKIGGTRSKPVLLSSLVVAIGMMVMSCQ